MRAGPSPARRTGPVPRSGDVPRVAGRTSRSVAVLVLALLGCSAPVEDAPTLGPGTEEAEAAPLGPSLALVVPDGLLGPAVLDEARAVTAAPVAGARVVVARDAGELADQLAVLAGSGTDVVCVLGSGGSVPLAATARLFPGTTGCQLLPGVDPASPDGLTVVLPIEALGAELGRFARTAATERAGDGVPGAVALATGPDPVLGAPLRRGLTSALTAGGSEGAAGDGSAGGAIDVPDVGASGRGRGGPGPRVLTLAADAAPGAAVADLLEAGVSVLVVDGAPGAVELASAAVEAGLVVLAPAAIAAALPEAGAERVVVTWAVAWDVVAGAVVAHVEAGAPARPDVLELALADVIRLAPGPAAGPVTRGLVGVADGG